MMPFEQPLFGDREDAGRALAQQLAHYAGRGTVLVLALPRGGVPVGFQVSEALHAPLDVFLVRKLGVPGQEELAMGAIASGGVCVLNEQVVRALDIPQGVIEREIEQQQREMERRARVYRGDRSMPDVTDRVVILVDDGLATGSTMRAAAAALRLLGPARVVVAVPVAAEPTCVELRREVDEVVCAATPDPFYAVGLWYEEFTQTTDEEVRRLLERAARERPAAAA
jgi:putative phosphoribosyl transferase